MVRGWLALSVALLMVGCAGKKPVEPPSTLWNEADSAFKDGAYEIAVDRYKALLDQYPFDPNAEEAELKIAHAHYLADRYPEAIAAFADFERMHPTSSRLPFVEYHLGMSYLAQATTSDRDQQVNRDALTYFRNVIDRFPQSPWAAKARLRLRECREALAQHEARVATYYLRRGNLRAAESRLRGLLTDYADTEASGPILYDFAVAYAKRDERDGASLALATLARLHPEDHRAQDARASLGVTSSPPAGEDPLPLLIAHIDRMHDTAERQQVPAPVSSYPEVQGGRY
jgi:outer membrane protein assembly factor BamD